MVTYTQENRLIAIETPLGKDVLLLRNFRGSEAISQLFSFDLDLLSADHEIKFEDIIGKRVSIRVSRDGEDERYFNGFISRFIQTGGDTGLATYHATMVPWLWFLTRTADCRIFQKLKVQEIIQQIFKDLGFTDVRSVLNDGKYDGQDYCVQYRETDFNFVSRLMEQYGIFYFFEHEKNKHTLVLADDPSNYQPCPGQKIAKWEPGRSGARAEDVITSLRWEQSYRSGKYAVTDYNFETPSTSLFAEIDTVTKVGGNEKYEIFDFPGEFGTKDEGAKVATIRMEEEEAQHLVLSGASTCRAFTTGAKFELQDYIRNEMNREYVLTAVQHVASVGNSYTTSAKGEEGTDNYSNTFSCIPHQVIFRPPQVTPKPVVRGPQTAVVVGKQGEEIWTDKYGRVKVQFHWDRYGKKNDDSSCWIRVSQNWAGKQWGAMFLPRINQEVIVEFLEGDPDRPIITGRVYNAELMPPYELPANQTQSGIKSRSSKGGSPANFNELRFEDQKGHEEICLHAEKNWKIIVENDKNQTVGHDEHLGVGNNRTIKVGANHTETIGGNMNLTVAGNQTETITMASAETVILAKALSVGLGYQVSVGAAMNETIGAAHLSEVGAYRFEKVVGWKTTDVKETITIKSEKEIVLETGSSKLSMNKDGTIELSGKDVTIKTDAGTIHIDAGGIITIKGSMVKINT